MGRKRAKAALARPAAPISTALARAGAPQTGGAEVDELPDDRIGYTDQHGVHWVPDTGTALPTVAFRVCTIWHARWRADLHDRPCCRYQKATG